MGDRIGLGVIVRAHAKVGPWSMGLVGGTGSQVNTRTSPTNARDPSSLSLALSVKVRDM